MKKVKNDCIIPDILLKIRTSNQWSLLGAVARRMSLEVKDLKSMLSRIDSKTLRDNGIWVEKNGTSYIICTNPRYGMIKEKGSGCACGAVGYSENATKRYFSSPDYNAGRHSTTNGKHKPQCSQWRPPTTGHLHSWRGGYNQKGKLSNSEPKGMKKKKKKKKKKNF